MRVRVLFLIGFAAICAGAAACTYDFTVSKKAPPTDAAVDPETGVGTTDAGTVGGDADVPPADAAPEFNCGELTVALAQLREQASACSPSDSNACLSTLRDECNCEFGVGEPTSAMSLGYGVTLQNYRDAGCTPTCNKPCPNQPDFYCDNTSQPRCVLF